MTSLYEKGLFPWLSAMPSKRWVIYAAGGFLSISVGGYLVYNHLKKRRISSDIPLDPDHEKSTTSKKLSDSSEKCTDPLAESHRIKQQGNRFFRDAEYQKAIDCYSKAIDVCPPQQKSDLSILYQNRAAAHEKLNDDGNVYEDCSQALQLNSRYIKALYRRGNLHERSSRWREATYDYMKCCILQNFTVEETAKKASKCLRSMSKDMAKEYLEKRRAENRPVPLSKTVVRATIRSFGCDPVFSKLQEIAEAGGHKCGETNDYGDGESCDGSSNLKTAVNLIKAQKYEESIKVCSEEIDLSKESTDLVRCLLIRSFFYNTTARFDEVRKDLHDALKVLEALDREDNAKADELNKLKCSAYAMFGFVEHLAGNLEESMRYLDQSEKLWPDNADVYSLRGQIRSLNNFDAELSIRDFAKAVELKPTFVHYHVQLLASEIKKASDEQDSLQLTLIMDRVKELLLKYPDHVEANMFFAQVMLEMENIALAVKHLEKACNLDPNSADIIAQIAFIDMVNERPNSALETVERALKIDPHCLAALEIMAQYYSKRSDLPKMMECYDRALEVARSEAEAAHFFNMRETTIINMKMAEEFLSS